jgi:AcrR family transcriptional regulator
MGTVERRERERQEMQTLILDAARELFATEGYEAVTMRRIAEKIEYSPTAIYSHFKDKLSLLKELCDRDFAAFAAVLQRAAGVKDPVERLRRIGYAYVDFALEYPNHYRFLFMTEHPPVTPEMSAIQRGNPDQDSYAFLRGTIDEGLAQGRFKPELRDPDLICQIAWASAHGLVSLHNVKNHDAWLDWRPPRETARRLIDLVLDGMLRKES